MPLGKVPKRVWARPCPRLSAEKNEGNYIVIKILSQGIYLHIFPRTIADRGVRRHVFDHTHAVITPALSNDALTYISIDNIFIIFL